MNPAEHENDETCDDHSLSLLSSTSIWSSLLGMIAIITVTLYYSFFFKKNIYIYILNCQSRCKRLSGCIGNVRYVRCVGTMIYGTVRWYGTVVRWYGTVVQCVGIR